MNVNKNSSFRLYREDWYLLAIFIMMASAIVIKSYFVSYGYLSPDSTFYLQLAQNLLEGKGYFVYVYNYSDRSFFALWPIGYSTIIFFTSLSTGLSVFWASKFLNIILLGIILCIFRFLFKHSAYLYGLIVLFSSYIEIFSFTWSETAFITALLWFATSIYLLIATTSRKRIIFLCFSIMISSLSSFLFRYIGAFSAGLIGLLGLYYAVVNKDRLKSTLLIGITVANILIMALYLHHNYTQTGFLTGMERLPAPETNVQLFYALSEAIVAETLISTNKVTNRKHVGIFFVQFIIIVFLLWKYRNNLLVSSSNDDRKNVTLSIVFSIVGLIYLISIIFTRWLKYFDEFIYRLLAPGSFFLFIAVIFFIHQRGTKIFTTSFKYFLISFCMLSFLIFVPYKTYIYHKIDPITYHQNIEMLKERYKDIERNSIIVFAPQDINYLYTDMQVRMPYVPYGFLNHRSHKEKWSNFMRRIDPKEEKNIYLYSPVKDRYPFFWKFDYDQSVKEVVKKYKEGTLVKLR